MPSSQTQDEPSWQEVEWLGKEQVNRQSCMLDGLDKDTVLERGHLAADLF